MTETARPGRVYEQAWEVTPERSAHAYGNLGVHVLATPALLHLIEAACSLAALEGAEPGQATVGTYVELKHLAPTPVGDTVRVRAELIEADGRRRRYRVEAYDSAEKVAEGVHERFIINLERFLERARAKRAGG